MSILIKTSDTLIVKLPKEFFDEVRSEDLPESLQEIVVLIGLVATLKLVESWPGIRVFIPRKMKQDHPIAEKIGFEAASILAQHFDGSEFPVPKAKFALILARDRHIRSLYGPLTAAQLAFKYDLTERQIYRIAAAVEVADTQESLF